MIAKYPEDVKALKETKQILKKSPNVPIETVQMVKAVYTQLKESDYAGFLE